jgi:hypothetical protein
MKIISAIFLILMPVVFSGMAPKSIPALKGEYLGQSKPGPRAAPFAVPVLAARPEHYIRAITFSADGREAYWPVIDTQDDFRRWIVFAAIDNGKWTQPRTAPFSDKSYYDDVPCLAPDGEKLFFLSGRPLEKGGKIDKERIWYLTRDGGSWSDPVPLPRRVNDAYSIHQQISIDSENNLYFGGEGTDGFGSLDIYFSRCIDAEYQTPVNLGPEINGPEGEYAPTVAPDGSYLIFTRNLDDGWSLFISFRTPDGAWTPPTDLKAHLLEKNSSNLSGSFVTGDGEYLVFFGEGEQTSSPYWIDTSFIEALRAKALGD